MKNNTTYKAIPIIVLLFAFSPVRDQICAQSCIGEQGKVEWLLYEGYGGAQLYYINTRPNWPQSPDYIEELTTLASPVNYNDNYGAIMRGFIRAPETGTYLFNLVGDDYSEFYLGDDSTSNNMTLLANVPGWSETDEHTKYPEQTSAPINFVQDEYYYFEGFNKEGGGGDHLWVYWQAPSDTSWVVVGNDYIFKYLCGNDCLTAGTPCDDSDANTTNDLEDGNCHCIGTPTTLPHSCIGEQGSLVALYYDGIPGNWVQYMYDSTTIYPANPGRAEILTITEGPTLEADSFGTRVRGYIRPPVTGNYTFNVTGNNEARFMLSPNQTTTIADEIAWNDGYADMYDHDNKPEQTSSPIAMTAGNFYAIEIVHKDNSGGDDFRVYWKTPFARDTFWHIIDGAYLYQYACETACIPEGTPCNDGDSNTFNDVYDASCNCTGTPCSDPQCTNSLGYTPLEPCDEMTERHSSNPNSAWLSCEPSESPNPERGLSHWIQYDFGDIYALSEAQIWNYNANDATGQGFEDIVIDYSLNGTDWSELGTFTWAEASGDANYSGFDFSAFSGVSARYILITALTNFNSSGCAGLSEVSFNATTCPTAGEPCDDGNAQTINDQYNENCYCIGELTETNSCDFVDLVKNEIPVGTGKYTAEQTITSAGLIKVGSNVVYVAGESISLEAEFEVEFGSEFLATISPCEVPTMMIENPEETIEQLKQQELEKAKEIDRKEKRRLKKETWLKISPNPASTWSQVEYNLPKTGMIRMAVYNSNGSLVATLMDNKEQKKGRYARNVAVQQFTGGLYTVSLFTENGVVTERMVVMDSR